MTLVFIIYGISWSVFLLNYLYSRFIKKSSSNNQEGITWYHFVLAITIAPLILLFALFFIVPDLIDKRKNKKWRDEAKEKERILQIHKNEAIENYNNGISFSGLSECVALGEGLNDLVKRKDYANILKLLNKLILPEGYVLRIKLAEHKGIGDRSQLFVTDSSGNTTKDLFEKISVEDSPLGAMQVFLLYELWHYLPLFWHANYSYRSYVYRKEDLMDISMFLDDKREQTIKMLEKYDITPIVKKYDDKYYVSCCYFSDFGGLIREFIEIKIKDNKVIDIFDANKNVLFEYDCGIKF